MGGVAIREARAEEARAVAALWTEAYVTLGVGGRADPYTEADFTLTAERGAILVVAVGDEAAIVGVVALSGPGTTGRAVATADEAELSRLAVAAAERGKGIGRSLVALCERRARAAGWPAIALWSRTGQVEAHRLYESAGYRRLAERDSLDSTGLARLAFLLDLDRAPAAE
jgi:ribosomal protein S18 acetylase RimI-like enzyme